MSARFYSDPILPVRSGDPSSPVEATLWYTGDRIKFRDSSSNQLIPTETILASVSNGQGASMIGLEDTDGYLTATDVEAGIKEIIEDFASTANTKGASKVGVEDAGGNYNSATKTVENIILELYNRINFLETGLDHQESVNFPIHYTKSTTGAPSAGGADGEYLLNTADEQYYVNSSGTWGSAVNSANFRFIFKTTGSKSDFGAGYTHVHTNGIYDYLLDQTNQSLTVITPDNGTSIFFDADSRLYTFKGSTTTWVRTFTFGDHNTIGGLQGGTTDEYYHLTSAQQVVVANLALTSNGDGAATVGIEDTGGYFAGTDVEAALQTLGASQANTVNKFTETATTITSPTAQYDITHSLGTKFVMLAVRDNGTDDAVDVNWKALDTNTIRIFTSGETMTLDFFVVAVE
jgi:hypothetical protein